MSRSTVYLGLSLILQVNLRHTQLLKYNKYYSFRKTLILSRIVKMRNFLKTYFACNKNEEIKCQVVYFVLFV